MLDARFRNAIFYDFRLLRSPDEAPIIPLADAIELLFERWQNGEAVKMVDNENAAIRIADFHIDYDNFIATILINYSDKRLSDPAFSHLVEGTLRHEPKLDGEGIAVSSHLVISLNPSNLSEDVYLCLLEDVPGVGRTKLEPFLKSEFRACSNYTFQDENGRNKPCRPVPSMSFYQSERLTEAFQNGGYLREVELVRYRVESDFDEIPQTVEDHASVVLKVEGKPTGDEAHGLLNTIKQRGRSEQYSEMRVRWASPTLSGRDKVRSVRTGTAREDAGDALFGKQREVYSEEPLTQCRSSIALEISDSLKNLILEER